MFCQKCGKEIAQDSAFCTNCGAPVEKQAPAEQAPPATPRYTVSENKRAVNDFKSKVDTIFIISIISIAANFIVGSFISLIAAIVAKVMLGKLIIPQFESFLTPDEGRDFEAAQKKVENSKLLSTLGLVISILGMLLYIVLIVVYVIAFMATMF